MSQKTSCSVMSMMKLSGPVSNTVAFLIMKTLESLGLLNNEQPGGNLNISFGNCLGQNKNNTVLKLISFLVEMDFLKKVNFVFSVVGCIKNFVDILFNVLKF
mmetsp:Transcript_8782/g.18221  ORF Transcript_8782/g.18221 Transcript_8782/m.18221 type:complete len:102 (+) Transcript_8782:495-800(+)